MQGGRKRRVCRISRKSGRCTLRSHGKANPECRKSRKTRRCHLRRSAKSRSMRPVLGRRRVSRRMSGGGYDMELLGGRMYRRSSRRVSRRMSGGGHDMELLGGRKRRVCRISRKSGRCTLRSRGKANPECRKSRKTRRCHLRRSAKSRSTRPVLGRRRSSRRMSK